MRAVVVRELNAKPEVVDVELAEPGPGQVRVKLAAAGVCHSDLSFLNGTIPHPLPIVLGHEGAGVVTGSGAGVSGISEGDHVIINWVPYCGTCSFCIRGEHHLCMTGYMLAPEPPVKLDGAPVFPAAGTGTFAEEILVHHTSVVPIPADVPLDVAALIGCGVTTGVGAAINTAKVAPGSTVCVIGCGGVGINVIQGARICGAATIVAVDKAPGKLEDAKRFGATHAVTPEQLGTVSAEVTGGDGFDYAFEVIGLGATIRSAYDATRRGGTMVVVGAGRVDDTATFSAFELFFNAKNILGCVYGSAEVRRDFPRMLALWKAGRLDLEGLISRRVSLDDIEDAFEVMQRGEVIRQVIDFA